jgi:tripartite-type tricarboxylate transporter receptor subunit TctC
MTRSRAFAPVAWVARVPNVLVVNANSSIRSLKDLVAQAQAHPGRLSYSSGGNGSAAHIAFEYLKLRTKIFMSHIPYRGTAPFVTDLISGQVDATFTGGPAVMPHVKSGRLRALAVSSSRRMAAFPDVPTAAESGYPGFEADQWYGVVAPAGTPADLVARLNLAINKIVALPEVAQQLAGEGAEPVQATPQVLPNSSRARSRAGVRWCAPGTSSRSSAIRGSRLAMKKAPQKALFSLDAARGPHQQTRLNPGEGACLGSFCCGCANRAPG